MKERFTDIVKELLDMMNVPGRAGYDVEILQTTISMIEEVRNLHKPWGTDPDIKRGIATCATCEHPWPCSTALALRIT